MTSQADTLPNTTRELTAGELDNVGGGAAPGQGVEPNAPPAGTDPQPINPGAILATEVSAAAAVPAAVPGLL